LKKGREKNKPAEKNKEEKNENKDNFFHRILKFKFQIPNSNFQLNSNIQ